MEFAINILSNWLGLGRKSEPKLDDDDVSISALRCIHQGLELSQRDIQRLRQQRTTKLLEEKKLVLVLDLDLTLVHSIKAINMSQTEQELLNGGPKGIILGWPNGGRVTKLRPGVHEFLKEASQMYDMYIYTLGCREYALQTARFLDPEGVYFDSKVLSAEDCTRRGRKGLDVVLADERVVVVLDDNEYVWRRHEGNLIRIEGYCFFGLGHGLPFDAENESDDALATALDALKFVHRMFFDCASGKDVRNVLGRFRAEGGKCTS